MLSITVPMTTKGDHDLATIGPNRYINSQADSIHRHDILCPNEVKRDVEKTCRKSDVKYAPVFVNKLPIIVSLKPINSPFFCKISRKK